MLPLVVRLVCDPEFVIPVNLPVSQQPVPHPAVAHVDAALELETRYQQLLVELFGRINYERSPELAKGAQAFPLARMQGLLDRVGNPQLHVPCIHVAGSKGKGSTATMIARVLEAAGYRVGLFTSPHAQRFEERFTINGTCASVAEVVAILEQLREVTREMDQSSVGGPTFFELATCAGWLHFLNAQVDLAVIEVGLGGRLDSTNLCAPLVSIITSISRDHTRLLGNTEELIAREKAGIIKPGIPVVSGVLQPGPAAVIEEIARQQGAPLSQLETDFEALVSSADERPRQLPTCCRLTYRDRQLELAELPLAMPGEHQVRNAALAVATAFELHRQGYAISPEQIRSGLQRAVIPLRIEVLQQRPLVIFDSAHNHASVQALCESLAAVQATRRTCIFASSRDKETAELLRILGGAFDQFILTAYQENPRAVPVAELLEIAQSVMSVPCEVAATPALAMEQALSAAGEDDLLCVTGSFFLAAEVQSWWNLRRAATTT